MEIGKTVVLLGPPGSGKGTQANMLEQIGYHPISAGNLLRREVNSGTTLGQSIEKLLANGELVQDEITASLVDSAFDKLSLDDPVVLEGFPRTARQVELLNEVLESHGRSITTVFNFICEEDVVIERLGGRWTCTICYTPYNVVSNPPEEDGLCDHCSDGKLAQRPDDTGEGIKRRLELYHEETAQAISILETTTVFVNLPSNRDIKEIGEIIGLMVAPEIFIKNRVADGH